MKRVRFWLNTRGAVWAGLAGAALLLAAVCTQWFAVAPLEREVAALRQVPSARDELQDRTSNPWPAQRDAAGAARGVSQPLQCRPRIGDAPCAPARVALFEHGLELQRGDYRLTAVGDDGLARYRMEVPIQGRYPNIRAFALQALHEMPTVALEQLQFQRRSVTDQQVDAVMSFNLFIAR